MLTGTEAWSYEGNIFVDVYKVHGLISPVIFKILSTDRSFLNCTVCPHTYRHCYSRLHDWTKLNERCKILPLNICRTLDAAHCSLRIHTYCSCSHINRYIFESLIRIVVSSYRLHNSYFKSQKTLKRCGFLDFNARGRCAPLSIQI